MLLSHLLAYGPTVYGPRPAKEVLGAAQDQNDTAEGAIILQNQLNNNLKCQS